MASLKILIAILIMLACITLACAPGTQTVKPSPTSVSPSPDTTRAECDIRRILDQTGPEMDYDGLMQVYRIMIQSEQPIDHLDLLIGRLIQKRNTDPRVDQMILIFSARVLGASKYPVANAQDIFEAIVNQDRRLNEWVISFVAEAIGDYPYTLPGGDQLVDALEAKLARLRSTDRSAEEYFGFHFLPPPKSEFIRTYIKGITEQSVRQRERSRYYLLIRNHLTESEIEPALKYLRAHGAPDGSGACPHLMECLLRFSDRLPFKYN